MNFQAVENICSIRVTKILRTMPSTQGTVVFLKMTKDILDSSLDKNIAAIEQIYLIWKSVFFLRIWRQWLLENGYTLQNFISSNAYTCIEINAHAIVAAVNLFRQEGVPEFFVICGVRSYHHEL